jgi:6-pyruvoyltetrahydropterin/6-carboxytetrahydropterin synthase
MKLKIKHHFEAAHRLSNYPGKCKNLHGHRWEVEVELDGIIGMENGMVVDFGDIKNVIDVNLDHRTLLSNHEDNDQLAITLIHSGCAVESYPWEPTAENLVKWIWDLLKDCFQDSITQLKVILWESPSVCAEYQNRVVNYTT